MDMRNFLTKEDCSFKVENKCKFPKTMKFCLVCSVYLKNTNRIEDDLAYITLVLSRRSQNISLLLAFLSLIISFSLLLDKLFG